MYFSETSTLRSIEKLMLTIPNFRPRGHGVMILCKHEYTAKDCDCSYCPYHTGRGRKIACRLERCACLKERIEAGAATQKEILTETMAEIKYPPFVRRLNLYLNESEEYPMEFKNEKHRELFGEVVRRKDKKDYALMAALYLLTADFRLWNTVKHCTEKAIIDFDRVRLKGIHPTGYTLYCCAKDLYLGTKHMSVSDLADTELIPPKVFGLICNAMAIRRFGLGAVNFNKERNLCND